MPRFEEFEGPTLPEGATPAPGIPANAKRDNPPRPGPDVNYQAITDEAAARIKQGGQETLAKIAPGKLMGGNQRVSPKSMKGSALLGRNDNLSCKRSFKDGSQDARDTDGLHTVTVPKGTMRSPAAEAESKRQPVKRVKKVN